MEDNMLETLLRMMTDAELSSFYDVGLALLHGGGGEDAQAAGRMILGVQDRESRRRSAARCAAEFARG